MVIFDVGLEMLGKVVDALGRDRSLLLGRADIAGLYGVTLDPFGLADGCYRHRVFLLILSRLRSAAGPGCRPAWSPHYLHLRGPPSAQAGQYRKIGPGTSGNCDAFLLAGTGRSRRQTFVRTPSPPLRARQLEEAPPAQLPFLHLR